MNLWNHTPGEAKEIPAITPYLPALQRSDAAVVIFPGGAYAGRAPHEGRGYAEFLAANGITAFDVAYRVAPHRFPLELLDARRAVRWVRAHAEEYGLDKNKIAVMGSSAGGHLAALVSTYRLPIDYEEKDNVDREDYLPNAQILCYPVILSPDEEGLSHAGSYKNLIGERDPLKEKALDPSLNVAEDTPPAFLWHTAEDKGVSVINSYRYATALRLKKVPVEMHIFPYGPHGLGLAPSHPHTAQWSGLLINWLKEIGYLDK